MGGAGGFGEWVVRVASTCEHDRTARPANPALCGARGIFGSRRRRDQGVGGRRVRLRSVRDFSQRAVDRVDLRQELVQLFEADLTGAVAGRRRDVGMGLDE